MAVSTFWQTETGAVSVDLMALSALMIIMSLGLIAQLQSGTEALSSNTNSALEGAQVMELGTLGQSSSQIP